MLAMVSVRLNVSAPPIIKSVDNISNYADEFKKGVAYINNLETTIQSKAADKEIQEIANSFNAIKTEENSTSKKWLIGIRITLAVLFGMAVWILCDIQSVHNEIKSKIDASSNNGWNGSFVGATNQLLFLSLAAKLTIMAISFIAFGWISRQYALAKKQARNNAHYKGVIGAYVRLQGSITGPEERAILITEMSRAIFPLSDSDKKGTKANNMFSINIPGAEGNPAALQLKSDS